MADSVSSACFNSSAVALLARRLLDAFGQLEGDRKGQVAHLRARRHFRGHLLEGDAEFFAGGLTHNAAQSLLQLNQTQAI
jgi:hypothetical protein